MRLNIDVSIQRDMFKRMVLGDGILPIPNEYVLSVRVNKKSWSHKFWFPKNTWTDSDLRVIKKYGWKFSPWTRYPKK